ncbi:type II toxin-antitoxin system PemK/MazF family toxin [Geminocystis herdmanii]|uniref:type II toxin-antitoxin system PemK/MazF family toxin n=1 Tax=Geminocystis herdmanii TaxID=669359 RepID=UPI000349D379|nr:type II toxin-antitoxin system PemK/MazF family toxin [Geminocystis herdmanii]
MTINPQKGEIWQVNLDPTIGQEIKKIRPVVVIISNIYNPIALRIIITITTWQDKFLDRPFMIKISQDENNGLVQDSGGNVLQIRSISTQRFMKKIGIISHEIMSDILASLMISVDYF